MHKIPVHALAPYLGSSPSRSVSLLSSPGFGPQYYGNDYMPIASNNGFANITAAIGANTKPLYNGNISSMAMNIPKLGDVRVYTYTYDQLNRITAMDVWGGLNKVFQTNPKNRELSKCLLGLYIL